MCMNVNFIKEKQQTTKSPVLRFLIDRRIAIVCKISTSFQIFQASNMRIKCLTMALQKMPKSTKHQIKKVYNFLSVKSAKRVSKKYVSKRGQRLCEVRLLINTSNKSKKRPVVLKLRFSRRYIEM